MSEDRKERLQTIDVIIRRLQVQINDLHEERNKLQMEENKEKYPCACVKLNGDIEIYDMQEQERRKRNPLSLGGFVANTLSARFDCPQCKGTGQPS